MTEKEKHYQKLTDEARRDAEKYFRHRARQLGTTPRRALRDWEPEIKPKPDPIGSPH